jgi:hypothetical protein
MACEMATPATHLSAEIAEVLQEEKREFLDRRRIGRNGKSPLEARPKSGV